MLLVESRPGERSARQVAANREATIPLILDEVLRQRKEQDDRLEYLRRIAGLFLSIFLPGSALVLLSLDQPVRAHAGTGAGALFLLGFVATLVVLWQCRWYVGPKITSVLDGPYRSGQDIHSFRHALVQSHAAMFRFNERVVRRVQRWLAAEISCFSLSAAVLGAGLAG